MCEWGDETLLWLPIPAHLSHTGALRWAAKGVDRCIAALVQTLNDAGIYTAGSCCGHGAADGAIVLHNGRTIALKGQVMAVPLGIALTEARHALAAVPGDVADKLRAAMRVTRHHWLCTNKDEQLLAAVGAVMDFYGPASDEWRRLEWELGMLRKISVMVLGAQAGLSLGGFDELDEDMPQPVGILRIWHEDAP